jgi:alpha-amylase
MDKASDDGSCPSNSTVFQGFEWYLPADHKHWVRLACLIPSLAQLGITSMWIPPAAKGASTTTVGYDIYDLWDLGEFDQKGGVATKYGTKEELVHLVDTANKQNIRILFDAVLNHKIGADSTDTAVGIMVNPEGMYFVGSVCLVRRVADRITRSLERYQ